MYLKRVEVYGFKSFADKTEISFSPGITAIVGPNGSGKSNIADAIRWALGEQSAKTLRGSRMEDVIFSGSSARRPLGFAEVTLVFDNGDNYLPVDFLEVQVTRRVYRSGASEFYISGVPCRLKDIHALFMDTGLGRSGYSFIEQGRIDAILAAGSDQRRAFLEEAAGIHKYKTRRSETERRLEAVSKNCARIQDLVLELGRQLEPLAKRADDARQFKSYSDRLSVLEISLILGELDKLNLIKNDVMAELSCVSTKLVEMREEQETLDNEIIDEKARLAELEEERDETHSDMAELGREIERIEGKVGIACERLTSLEKQRISLDESKGRDEAALSGLEEELKNKKCRLEEIRVRLKEAEKHLAAGESREDCIQRELNEKREQEESLKVDVIEVLSKLAEVKNELTRKRMNQESEERQAKREMQQLEHAEQELDEISRRLEHDKKHLLQLDAKKDNLSQEILKIEKELQHSGDELERLYELRRNSERKSHEKSLELEACRRQVTKGGWHPEGTRAIMAAGQNGALQGVIGTLADVIRVPGKYEYAIEAALGRSIHNIIVEKESHAKSGVAYLKDRRLGRATFLPLDLIRPAGFSLSNRHVLDIAGVHGIAAQLVSYDEPVKKAVEFSLGRILVVDNLDVAVKATRMLNGALKIVTIDGDIVFPGGAISGGSRPAKRGGRLLEARRRLSDLELEARHLRDDELQVIQQIEAVKAAVRDWENRRAGLASDRRAIELEAVRLRTLEAERRKELDKARLRADMLRSQLQLRKEKEECPDEAGEDPEDRHEELTVAGERLSKAQSQLSDEIKRLSSARDEAIQDITATKVRIATLRQEAENLMQGISSLEASCKELASRVSATSREIIRVVDLMSETHGEVDSGKKHLDELGNKRLHVDKAFASVKDRYRKAVGSIRDKEAAVKTLQARIAELDKDETSLRLRKVEVFEGIRHMEDELSRAYRMTPEEARLQVDPRQYEDIKRGDNVREEISLLREKMDTIGQVDLSVIEIYESMKARQKYLEEGLKDIDEARDFLGKIIERCDKESERRFRETFNAVRQEFDNLFARLFQGGAADLISIDPEGSGLPGVDIVAQPPGKRLQNIMLLSAGEKALSAIALIFAILKIRPSPCCILDEIDAALDEANVGRFADLMRDAAGEGQYVVVTHRKGTMETADALYGVTMEESGVSKLVSLDLERTAYSRQETA